MIFDFSGINVTSSKVIVICSTYNHSNYICDTLNGFSSQNTLFPYTCFVIDDSSTDGEQDVIRNWLNVECNMDTAINLSTEQCDLVISQHKTNINCQFIVSFNKINMNDEPSKYHIAFPWAQKSEYVALCEGDDYWIDSMKLQVQTDILESHPDIDMCAHSYYEQHAISGKFVRKKYYSKIDCVIPLRTAILEEGDLLATGSILYRTKLEYNLPLFRERMYYDYTLYIHGALRGGIYYIHRYMSVYRRAVPNSWSEKLAHSEQMHKEFILNRNSMLDILDKEFNNKYHSIVQERKLLNILEASSKRRDKLLLVKDNSNLLDGLSLYQKSVIFCKCFCPKFGHLIIKTFRMFRLRIDFC